MLDSQEEMTSLNNSASKADESEDFFQRLKKMFPDKSENRMRAALIVYPRDFKKAVQFMVSEPSPKTGGNHL